VHDVVQRDDFLFTVKRDDVYVKDSRASSSRRRWERLPGSHDEVRTRNLQGTLPLGCTHTRPAACTPCPTFRTGAWRILNTRASQATGYRLLLLPALLDPSSSW
jgi:hypothetical protein